MSAEGDAALREQLLVRLREYRGAVIDLTQGRKALAKITSDKSVLLDLDAKISDIEETRLAIPVRCAVCRKFFGVDVRVGDLGTPIAVLCVLCDEATSV